MTPSPRTIWNLSARRGLCDCLQRIFWLLVLLKAVAAEPFSPLNAYGLIDGRVWIGPSERADAPMLLLWP